MTASGQGFAIGLTGGIGSGKSTVAALFQRHGAGIIDADALVHELVAPGGAAIPDLRDAFGAAVITADGGLDRARMRALAFTDPPSRQRLETILHPRVRALSNERAAALAASSPYLVFVVPLLVETGNWRERVQRVLVVDCSEAVQLARVCARPGMDAATAQAIVRAQATRQARLAAADDVLFNEAPLADIEARVAELNRRYSVAARGGVSG